MQPLVSICIPVCNAERFIAETLESALAQTYQNFEVIVSDDASIDRTVEVVLRYVEHGVRLIEQPKNLGMHGNWNAVIRASSGKYVLKLDADDLIMPDHIAEQVAVFEEHPEVVFAHCACRLINANGRFLGYERSIHGSFIRTGIEEWPRYVFGPRAVNIVTLRRSAYDAVGGYDERYQYSGDWAMHRALLKIGSVFYNDRVLASYRLHSVGKEGVKQLLTREHLMHLEDMERDWPKAVPNKTKLLKQASKLFAIKALLFAATCSPSERENILKITPRYTEHWQATALLIFLRFGGVIPMQLYVVLRRKLRLLVKAMIFTFLREATCFTSKSGQVRHSTDTEN
jgi:glycosyltransferase involved in cell wall biosynthesis